jgi:hypothetical protein
MFSYMVIVSTCRILAVTAASKSVFFSSSPTLGLGTVNITDAVGTSTWREGCR